MITARGGQLRVLREGIAVGWLVMCAAGFLAPALSHGSAIGPYDLLQVLGVTSTPHPHVHNAVVSDQIQEFIPWQVQDWLQVRAGHVPLWQPANLLGMPLAFNFQSAPFSLPVAFGYVFPLHLAYTATVVFQLVLGGIGVYVLCRMLRLEILPAVVGATIFQLCGGFTIWLGAYEAGCCCLLGWALAASVALLRGRRRAGPLAVLALVLALAFAGGEPQIDALFVALVALFVAVVAARGRASTGSFQALTSAPDDPGLRRWRWRVLLDHVLALAAACGLAAPIYLPGIQILLRSVRVHGPYASGLSPHNIVNLLLPWYSGVPTNLASVVGPDDLYVASVSIGVIGLVLALTGLAYMRRRPEVLAFGLAGVVLILLLYVPPVTAAIRRIPDVQFFRVDLGTTFLDFALAILAAFGAQALLRTAPRRGDALVVDASLVRWTGRLFLTTTVVVALAMLALGMRLAFSSGDLTEVQRSVRTAGFLWPSISVAACALVAASWHARQRPAVPRNGAAHRLLYGTTGVVAGRTGLAALVIIEAAFCIVSGGWYLSSTSEPLHATASVAALQRIVDAKLVAMGTCPSLNTFPQVGIMVDTNAAYGVDEFADYDPITTLQYYRSLADVAGTARVPPATDNLVLCPSIRSASVARYYGVSYILDPVGSPAPKGTTLVTVVHQEAVYAVRDAGRATLVPLGSGRAGVERPDQVVAAAHEAVGGTWHVAVHARRRSLLVLRVTSLPGWRATIDGKPLQLRTFGTVMLAAVVPAGRHVITLRYSPRLWSVGLLIAAATASALLAALVAEAFRRRRAPRREPRHAPRTFRPTTAEGAAARRSG